MLLRIIKVFVTLMFLLGFQHCVQEGDSNMTFSGNEGEVKILTLDPGHFHAALVQKNENPQVSTKVHIYADEGDDVIGHMKRIEGFNTREENPTNWESILYSGPDFFEKMIAEKKGNVVVISGNNEKKTEYIKKCIDAGLNVLADKPMCIDKNDFALLHDIFDSAEKNNVLLYDIMTERSEITTLLQKEFIEIPELFGEVIKGTPDNPAVIKSSVHHFFKYVSGKPLKRPSWFFDASKQGDGVVDVTTHLVDLVQWELFPEDILDYKKDVNINSVKRWPTQLTLDQFENITKLEKFPDYLQNNINQNILDVFSNGEINYKLKGIQAKVVVEWKYQAPEGGGDTHFSVIKGTKSNVFIRQGKEQNYKPELFIEAVDGTDKEDFHNVVVKSVDKLEIKYPGINVKKENDYWHIFIPKELRIGHEAHFGQVLERYLSYLVKGELPAWEIPNMITKYYTTTKALEIATKN